MEKLDRTRLAASYARKSTADDLGVRDQHDLNVANADRDGMHVPDHPDYRFGDDDITGAATSRPALDRLLSLVRSGAPFSVLYVKDMTRLGRFENPRHFFHLSVELEMHGVKVRFGNRDPGAEAEPDDMRGYLHDVIDSIGATHERRNLIERVTKGMRNSVMNGFFPGSPPYGTHRWYADRRTGDAIEPVDETRRLSRTEDTRFVLRWNEDETFHVVRRIFEWYADGLSLRSIARKLGKEGVPSPSGRAKWSAHTVRNILGNPIYQGDLVWGRTTRDGDPVSLAEARVDGSEPIRVQEFLPDAPVSRDLFRRVQALLGATAAEVLARKRKSPGYLLSGLLRCAECGVGLHGHTSTAQYPTRRLAYRHNHTVECPNRGYIRVEQLEEPVEMLVESLLCDDGLVREAEAALSELSAGHRKAEMESERARLERKHKEREAVMSRLVDQAEGLKSASARAALDQRIEAVGAELDRLQRRGTELENEGDRAARMGRLLGALKARSPDLAERFRTSTPEVRQAVLRELISHIEVDRRSKELSVHLVALADR